MSNPVSSPHLVQFGGQDLDRIITGQDVTDKHVERMTTRQNTVSKEDDSPLHVRFDPAETNDLTIIVRSKSGRKIHIHVHSQVMASLSQMMKTEYLAHTGVIDYDQPDCWCTPFAALEVIFAMYHIWDWKEKTKNERLCIYTLSRWIEVYTVMRYWDLNYGLFQSILQDWQDRIDFYSDSHGYFTTCIFESPEFKTWIKKMYTPISYTTNPISVLFSVGFSSIDDPNKENRIKHLIQGLRLLISSSLHSKVDLSGKKPCCLFEASTKGIRAANELNYKEVYLNYIGAMFSNAGCRTCRELLPNTPNLETTEGNGMVDEKKQE